MNNNIVRRSLVALLIAIFVAVQGTWALAGTTGGLSGTVTDEHNAPVAAATVSAASPSGSTTTSTDATGHYVFLSLAPDTYTVSMGKAGFQSISQAGVTVFADQTQTLEIRTKHESLREIGVVTSKSANDLVKSGTTSDVYSVNAATAETVNSIGGGGNLNNAYSALASQPGIMVPYGAVGWGQTPFIHGASYSQIGYEYDGIPVNRAFDNYNANSLSNLGQQELQIVTGGSPSASSAATVGGFINQVIRTGRYPGFGNIDVSVGGPAFYHGFKAEAGGATPNRLFSYYVGLLGTSQTPRFFDQFNGGGGVAGITPNVTTFESCCVNTAGVFPLCNPDGTAPAFAGPAVANPGCVGGPFPAILGAQALVSDREAVANFHIGIPHKRDGGRDDIQLLYTGSFQPQTYYDSINDQGGYQNICNKLFGAGGTPCTTGGVIPYADSYIYPDSVKFGQIATPALAPIGYAMPGSPLNRCLNVAPATTSGVPIQGACSAGTVTGQDLNARAGQSNAAQIIKLQYQKNMGANAYLRAYGYTFYSDWLLNNQVESELFYKLGNFATFPATPDYELITHTRGGEIQFADQLNAQHLITLTGNYTTAGVSRFNNGTFRNGFSAADGSAARTTNLINPADPTGTCRNAANAIASCYAGSTSGTFANPTPFAAPAGANWVVTFAGPRGTLNRVRPDFSSLTLNDEFRPNDKLLFNLGLRTEQFKYNLTPTNGPDYQFWFNAAANSYCYDPAQGNAAVFTPQGNPAIPGGNPLFAGVNCPVSPVSGLTTVHPNGTVQAGTGLSGPALLFSSVTNPTVTRNQFEPRFSGTYTVNPDTVVRFSAGRYANPFNTATVEYLDAAAKRAATFDFQTFFGFGFTTPEHDVQPSVSTNVDFSLEHHMKGTDVSFKVSPFYRYVTNQTQDALIGPGFVSAIPTNNETAYGIEAQISKGDPTRNGWSGQLSYTWTKALSKFNALGNGQNFIDGVNTQIAAYNALTAAGSGTSLKLSNGQSVTLGTAAPCYLNGAAAPAGSCTVSGGAIVMTPAALAAGAVQNPYYFMAAQPYMDPGGKYPLYQTFPSINANPGNPDTNETIVWPQVVAGFLNYKHNRLAIAPNFELIQGFSGGAAGGGQYGSPFSVVGLDPRSCSGNQSVLPAGSVTNPALPNYQTCGGSPVGQGALYIPNPETGTYDSFGKYQNPWLLNINTQIRYELSKHVTANLVLANIFNRCFGGSSTAWTSANPPGNNVCGYFPNANYVGKTPGQGFFLGDSPHSAANTQNPFTRNIFQAYTPATSFLPFSAYLTLQIKI